jgi:hypothetical protein
VSSNCQMVSLRKFFWGAGLVVAAPFLASWTKSRLLPFAADPSKMKPGDYTWNRAWFSQFQNPGAAEPNRPLFGRNLPSMCAALGKAAGRLAPMRSFPGHSLMRPVAYRACAARLLE